MALKTLVKHGSEAGYNAERATGNICERCRAAHRVWDRRKGKKGQIEGLRRYTSHDIIDHLDLRRTATATASRPRPATAPPSHGATGAAMAAPSADDTATAPPVASAGRTTPTLAERLTTGLSNLVMPDGDNDVIETDETPDYLHSVEPDPEPSGEEWSEVTDADFVINAAGMQKIEENLGTYLSVVGMTVEMVDPYCGPILAENFDNIVNRWSKVVAHYPAAAKLFLDGRGGVIFSWIGALQATWPFLLALYDHHLARNIKINDGVVYRRTGNGNAPVDSTTPPMPDAFSYTAN